MGKSTFYMFLVFMLFAGCKEKGQVPFSKHDKDSSTSPTASHQAPDSVQQKEVTAARLIVPGKAIGHTKLNEEATSIYKALGSPDKGDAAMGKASATWYANHDTTAYQTSIFFAKQMGVDERSLAKQIRITSPWFKTKDNIGAGSFLSDIERFFKVRKIAAYSEGGQPFSIYDSESGIAFEIDRTNRCTGIIIHEANKSLTTSYLPFHADINVIE